MVAAYLALGLYNVNSVACQFNQPSNSLLDPPPFFFFHKFTHVYKVVFYDTSEKEYD